MAMKLITATVIATLVATTATAQGAREKCGPTERVYDMLEQKFSEARKGYGVTANGAVIEFWVSETGPTWTMLATLPDGNSCIVADGADWGFEPLQREPNL